MSNEQKNPLVWPSVDGMMSDALKVIEVEITKFKTIVLQGRSLDSKQAKTLQGYIKSLVELSKEDRERLKDLDLSQLSTEELLALLGNKAPKALAGNNDR
jgi:hypothetical protein